jgi:hypothetical protein
VQELRAPPDSGPTPTCGGSYHFVLTRRGLFGVRENVYAHFDHTGTTTPPLLVLLEKALRFGFKTV